MKQILSILLALLISGPAYSSPIALQCHEGLHRLIVDLKKSTINIFEFDSFTQKEISLFGFAHTVSSYRMCAAPRNEYLHFDLKIKNDGQLQGKFQFHLNQNQMKRDGMVTYTGWFSWEPIPFRNCELTYE